MSLETVKDILDWTQKLHQKLSDAYEEAAEEIGDERASMLLKYVAEHERVLSESITRFEKDSNVQLMDTWFQEYVDNLPFMIHSPPVSGFPTSDPAAIIEMTIKAHQSLIDMYKEFAELAKTAKVKELFEEMLFLENSELKRMVTSMQRMADL